MKGNEARVVFFLHPVDQMRNGQVSKVKQLRSSFGGLSLLLLGLIFGLGFLLYGVSTTNQQEVKPTRDPGLVSIKEVSDTRTLSAVTERTKDFADYDIKYDKYDDYYDEYYDNYSFDPPRMKSNVTWRSYFLTEKTTEDTINKTTGTSSSAETETLKKTTLPGTIPFFVMNPADKSFQICHFAEVAWFFYPLVASSSLLLVYLAVLIMKWGYSRSKLVQRWIRVLTGKSPKEEMLLHTLPYYLAITRSSCEVTCRCFLKFNFEFRKRLENKGKQQFWQTPSYPPVKT